MNATPGQVAAWYVAGDSIATISARTRSSYITIRSILRGQGVLIRAQGHQRWAAKREKDREAAYRRPPPVFVEPPRDDDEEPCDDEPKESDARCTCGLRVDKDHTPETCDLRAGATKFSRRQVDYRETY